LIPGIPVPLLAEASVVMRGKIAVLPDDEK
jgi:hypothetical protein